MKAIFAAFTLLLGLAFAGVFGYFYFTNESDHSAQRAQDAMFDTVDAGRDVGVARLVDLRLKSVFGIEATRFLHCYSREGVVYIYGLAPENADADRILEEAREVPGVSEINLLTQPLPAAITGEKPAP